VNPEGTTDGGNTELTRQAAEWYVRISCGEPSEQEYAQWLQWCSSAENAAVYRRIRAINQGVDLLRPEASALLDQLQGSGDSGAGTTAPRPTGHEPIGPAVRIARWMLVAAIAALGVAASWYALESSWISGKGRIAAPRIALQSSALPDGSKTTLAPLTTLSFDFSGARRNLQITTGEAFFKVRPDKSRPFVVRAGEVSATAVGTAFDVKSEADRVAITVQEGTVRVESDAMPAKPARSWSLTAGFRAVVDRATRSVTISTVNPAVALGWREGRLNYSNEPLRGVIADVNRYSTRRIEIQDAAVGNLSFTGTVFTSAVDDWLAAVQTTFHIRAVSPNPDLVILSEPKADAASER
jgi:transmembrane sensor